MYSIDLKSYSVSFLISHHYSFKTSAKERPLPHTAAAGVDVGDATAAAPIKLSNSGLEDKLDLSSELESSILAVITVAFPEWKLERFAFFQLNSKRLFINGWRRGTNSKLVTWKNFMKTKQKR